MTIEQIKQRLAELKWTNKRLAEKLHIHEVTLNLILSGKNKLTDQLSAHIELLLNNAQEQLIMFKITYPDAVVQSWLPGWEKLTDEQRKAGIEAVLREAAEQLISEQKARMTPEEVESLKAFCSTLRGAPQVFEYGSPEEEPKERSVHEPYAEVKKPFA